MRFTDYLIEKVIEKVLVKDLAKIKATLEKECGYYLDLLKSIEVYLPLMRGAELKPAKKTEIPGLYKGITRQNRKPFGMEEDCFKNFNKWLEKNHHVRRDKAVIAVSGAKDYLYMFGEPCFFFPIGKFNYTWIKAEDVNFDTGFEDYFCQQAMNIFPPPPFEKDFNERMNRNITTNKGFDEAYEKEYEMWFDCKSYYLVRAIVESGKNILVRVNPLTIEKAKRIGFGL